MIVTKKRFSLDEFRLESGAVLRDVEIGYETYGQLAPAADNALLICHYFSGTSHAAGRYHEADPEPGWWDGVIGPGKPIDTERWFVISVDTLCNANVKMPNVITTGPASIDPETGRPYGSSFPQVTIGDFVETQKRLCDSLGIRKLHAIGGPSMGGLQALEWAVKYPEFSDRIIVAIAAGLSLEPYLVAMLDAWGAPIRLDPAFNDGEYYGQREPLKGLAEALKIITLNALHWDGTRRLFRGKERTFSIVSALDETARGRAEVADANSILRLCRAVQTFNIRDRLEKLRAKFLFIPARTDLLMPPEIALRSADELRSRGLQVDTYVIEGDGGHLDGLNLISQAGPAIRRFLDPLPTNEAK